MLKFTASDRLLAGKYDCEAINGVGEPARAQIDLNIIYPPEILTSRSWIHTAPGLRAQLECKVLADPQATVTWLKGEIQVPLDNRVVSLVDGDKHTLLIRNVQRSDFGIYTCRATNELGQGEVQIQLSDEAYAVAIRWYKDHDLLVDSGNESIPVPDRHTLWENGSLEIVTVKPIDTGEYTCEIERPEPWGAVRQRHAIEVLHQPSVEPFPPSGFLEVKLGEEVRMSCKGGGVPYPIITWYFQGEELKLLDHREMLKFTASDRLLAGKYDCEAINGVGEPARAQIDLNIIYPPEILTSRSWIHTAPGLRAQLECKVLADPQATVTWLKGEIQVPLDNRVVSLVDGDKHTLLIRNVQRSDFGIYTCRATNELGQGEVQIQLSGVPNPGVFKKTVDKNQNAPTFYTLIWEVDSYTPIIEYNLWFRPYKARSGLNKPGWTKLTIPTEHSSGPVYSKSYTIKGLKEGSIYEALLVSRNRYGWSKPSPILRFATAGAEIDEELMATAQIPQDNMIPLILATSSASQARIFVNLPFLSTITLMYFLKYK